MISENSREEIRLTFLVISLMIMDGSKSFNISERKKYEKYYYEITGQTWAKTKFLYVANLSKKDKD